MDPLAETYHHLLVADGPHLAARAVLEALSLYRFGSDGELASSVRAVRQALPHALPLDRLLPLIHTRADVIEATGQAEADLRELRRTCHSLLDISKHLAIVSGGFLGSLLLRENAGMNLTYVFLSSTPIQSYQTQVRRYPQLRRAKFASLEHMSDTFSDADLIVIESWGLDYAAHCRSGTRIVCQAGLEQGVPSVLILTRSQSRASFTSQIMGEIVPLRFFSWVLINGEMQEVDPNAEFFLEYSGALPGAHSSRGLEPSG